MKFGSILRELRQTEGLSQMQLAIKSGLSQSAIAHWELGETEPTAGALITLAEFFDISIDELLGRKVTYKRQFDYYIIYF